MAEMTSPDWSTYVETKNRSAVLRWLQGAGWEVKKSTFHNNCKKGLLALNRAGVYSRRAVRKYAEQYHVHSSVGQTVNDADVSLATEKIRKEIRRIETATTRDQFDLDVKMGKYVLRSDVEVELAARAVVLDNGFEYMFQANLSEIIAIVRGDQQMAPALLEFLKEKKDEQMNIYANMGEFIVALEIDDVEVR